jgi:hypothetical protein
MSKDMERWLKSYEDRRTNPDSGDFKMPSSWHSTKFDLENMSWDERREIPIPELNCRFGGACNALKKQWYQFKRLRKEGDRGWDIILRINKIQRALGIEMTEFRDGPDISWVKQQLDLEEGTGVEPSSEDLELRYEEDHEDWNDSETSEPEDPLYPQLRREEVDEAFALGLDSARMRGHSYPQKDDEWF